MGSKDGDSVLDPISKILQSPRPTDKEIRTLTVNFAKRWHPDRHPVLGRIVEMSKRVGAESILHVLNNLFDDPGQLDSWKNPNHQEYGRRIFFPRKGEMDSSVIVTVSTPRELFALLNSITGSRGLRQEDIVRCEAVAQEFRRDTDEDEEEDIPEKPDDFSAEIKPILESLNRDVHTLKEYIQWDDAHQDSFHKGMLSQPINYRGMPTTLRATLNMHALEYVRNAAGNVRDFDAFAGFREDVGRCGFFLTARMPVPETMEEDELEKLLKEYVDPSRAEANRIVKRTLRNLIDASIGEISNESSDEARRSAARKLRETVKSFGYDAEKRGVYLTRKEIAEVLSKIKDIK